MKRVLLVAEAVPLAHVCRVLALAMTLDEKQFDVTVAFDQKYRITWRLEFYQDP